MIFYLKLKTDRILSHVPLIDAITINIDGKSVVCHWDEMDAGLKEDIASYRLKGTSFVNDDGEEEYSNWLIKAGSKVYIEEILWKEDDNAEPFTCMACWMDIDAFAMAYENIIGNPGNLYVPETREQCDEQYIPPNPKYINCECFGNMDGMNGSCLWCKEMCPYQWEMCKDEGSMRRHLHQDRTKEEAIELINKVKKAQTKLITRELL